MAEVCSKFELVAAKLLGMHPATLFECTVPVKPMDPLDLSPPRGMDTEMRWRGVVWPTETVEACKAQGVKLAEVKDIKAGQSVREDGFKCVDAKTGETKVDFSVLRSCVADKDPAAPGSCKSEVVVKPKPATASSVRKLD